MEEAAPLPPDAIKCMVKDLPDYFHQNNLIIAKETFVSFDRYSQAWYQPIPDDLLLLIIKLYSDINKVHSAGFAIVPPPHNSLQNIEAIST